jgi:hypothetical protein
VSDQLLVALVGLGGVLVGAFVSGRTQWVLARREEKAQAKVGLRLLEVDFTRVHGVLGVALSQGYWAAGRAEVKIPSWAEYRAVLARALSPDDWRFVAVGVEHAYRAPDVFAERRAKEWGEVVVPLTKADTDHLRRYMDILELALYAIAKGLGDWPAETRDEPPTIPPGTFPERPPWAKDSG